MMKSEFRLDSVRLRPAQSAPVGGPATNIIPFKLGAASGSTSRPTPAVSDLEATRIEVLRAMASSSLLRSRADLERACRLIAVERSTSLRRCALALFATLSEHAHRRMIFFPVGAKDYSDDEIWLARTIGAFREHDNPAGRALIAWRLRPRGHRRARFLIGLLADALLENEGVL